MKHLDGKSKSGARRSYETIECHKYMEIEMAVVRNIQWRSSINQHGLSQAKLMIWFFPSLSARERPARD